MTAGIVRIAQLVVQTEMAAKPVCFLLDLSASRLCAPCAAGPHAGKTNDISRPSISPDTKYLIHFDNGH